MPALTVSLSPCLPPPSRPKPHPRNFAITNLLPFPFPNPPCTFQPQDLCHWGSLCIWRFLRPMGLVLSCATLHLSCSHSLSLSFLMCKVGVIPSLQCCEHFLESCVSKAGYVLNVQRVTRLLHFLYLKPSLGVFLFKLLLRTGLSAGLWALTILCGYMAIWH